VRDAFTVATLSEAWLHGVRDDGVVRPSAVVIDEGEDRRQCRNTAEFFGELPAGPVPRGFIGSQRATGDAPGAAVVDPPGAALKQESRALAQEKPRGALRAPVTASAPVPDVSVTAVGH
jgi:hypothetical protein